MGEGKLDLLERWESFRRSLLFYPVLGLLFAFALFAATSFIDQAIEGSVVNLQPYAWSFLVFAGNPAAARSVLGSIAGMWATITGVVYSVTLVTVQLSATKYTAAVIPRFEQDRTNRFVLGLYVATVAYSLLELKTVRVEAETTFAPVVGVNVAIVLALTSLIFLAVFIANLVAYIRPKRFVDDLAEEVTEEAERRHASEEGSGTTPLSEEEVKTSMRGRNVEWHRVSAHSTGYVTCVDRDALMKAAHRFPRGTRVRVTATPGTRVRVRDPLMEIALPPRSTLSVDDVLADLDRIVRVGDARSLEGDPQFGITTLGGIGVTAIQGTADLAVADRSLAALFDIACWEAEEGRAPRGFETNGVVVDTGTGPLQGNVLRQAAQIHAAAVDKRFWLLTESMTLHAARLLRRLAENGRRERFREALESLEDGLARALRDGDEDASLARAIAHLTRCEGDLRRAGLNGPAQELRSAIIEAGASARRTRGEPLGPRTTLAIEAAPTM